MNQKGICNHKGSNEIPEYIDILSIEDKIGYEKLQNQFSSPHYRFNRNKRVATLVNILQLIREYCECREADRSKRYLVCGICWFGEYLAVNTKQLRILISKSKSTINDILSKMGYSIVPTKGEQASLLIKNIPFLFGKPELKKWSIRSKKNDKKTVDEDDMYKEDIKFLDELFKNVEFNKRKNDVKSMNEDINFCYDQNNNDCLLKNDDEGFEIFDFEFIEFI